MRRKSWRIVASAIAGLLVAGESMLAWLNPQLTRYVESVGFRAELEKETAKGLHFSSGQYSPIRRTSFLTAESGGFEAEHGRKALTSMKTHGVAARFNPLGISCGAGSSM